MIAFLKMLIFTHDLVKAQVEILASITSLINLVAFQLITTVYCATFTSMCDLKQLD